MIFLLAFLVIVNLCFLSIFPDHTHFMCLLIVLNFSRKKFFSSTDFLYCFIIFYFRFLFFMIIFLLLTFSSICFLKFLAALGLSCCRCSFILVDAGYSLPVVLRLLIMMTALVVEYGLQYLWLVGSRAHRLSCSTAHGIFLDQGSNPRPLHWQAYSQPLDHIIMSQ